MTIITRHYLSRVKLTHYRVRNDREGEEARYHVVERSYGTFMRTFTLPQGVDESQIQAEFNDGVLSIRIPIAALPQPTRIKISGNQERQQASVGSGKQQMSSQGEQRNR